MSLRGNRKTTVCAAFGEMQSKQEKKFPPKTHLTHRCEKKRTRVRSARVIMGLCVVVIIRRSKREYLVGSTSVSYALALNVFKLISMFVYMVKKSGG